MNPELENLLSGLAPGENRGGLVCPFCGGGSSGEKSFSVRRDDDGGGVGWTCHRASCHAHSGRRSLPRGGEPVARPTFESRPYPHPLTSPPVDHPIWGRLITVPETASEAAELAAQIGLSTRGDLSSEVVWTARDYNWSTRGHVSRNYDTKFIRTWRVVDAAWYGYFSDHRTASIWLVEDPVSAACLQLAGAGAICLFGSSIGKALQAELGAIALRSPVQRFLLALDPDATLEGLTAANRLTNAGVCDTVWVPLRRDIKDMAYLDLLALMHLYDPITPQA